MFWQKKRNVQLSPRLRVGVGRGHRKHRALRLMGGLCLLLTFTILAKITTSENVGNQVNAEIPAVLGATDTSTSEQQPEESITYTYTAQPGDTLFNISQRLNVNVPWTTLAELNKLKPPFTLKAGQIIKIPNTK